MKLDVRSVEMFRQKSLISNQEAPLREVMMALIVFETKTNPEDVQIRGRGGHPDPEISRGGGGVVSKKFFGPQFGLKM